MALQPMSYKTVREASTHADRKLEVLKRVLAARKLELAKNKPVSEQQPAQAS